MTEPFPQNSILNTHWPDAQWDVSGAFVNDRELLIFHDFFLKTAGIKLLTLVHGSPLFLWNSGRVTPRAACTPEQMRNAARAYTRRGIAVDLTFSNHLLREEHLSNPLGNSLLELFEKIIRAGTTASFAHRMRFSNTSAKIFRRSNAWRRF